MVECARIPLVCPTLVKSAGECTGSPHGSSSLTLGDRAGLPTSALTSFAEVAGRLAAALLAKFEREGICKKNKANFRLAIDLTPAVLLAAALDVLFSEFLAQLIKNSVNFVKRLVELAF